MIFFVNSMDLMSELKPADVILLPFAPYIYHAFRNWGTKTAHHCAKIKPRQHCDSLRWYPGRRLSLLEKKKRKQSVYGLYGKET